MGKMDNFLTQEDRVEIAARKQASVEADKKIRDILAKHTKGAPELTRDQKVEKIAREMFDGDVVRARAFMHDAEARDRAHHGVLGEDY